MSDNIDLGWKATIKPNPNGNWVRFSRSGSQSESGTGSGQRTIKVDANTYAIRKEAVVTVVQDESNITKQFTIVQDQKCFVNVDISGDEGKIVSACGNSDSIVCDGDYAGVVIPAGTFGPNCSTSEKIVTAMVNSEMACSGGQLKVTAKQEANEQEWYGSNVTAKTSPSSIVFPYEGGSIKVKATATRQRRFKNCDCPQSSSTVETGYTWTVQMNPGNTEIRKECTFDELDEINGESGVTFTFVGVQKGPNCKGWRDVYQYNTKDTVEILSLYSGNTIIYATTANRNESLPDWLDGNVSFEFPYWQQYSYGACDCTEGCDWVAAENDGVINSNITQGNSMFKCEGSVDTMDFTHTFSFMGDNETENMGRNRIEVHYDQQYFTIRALADTNVTFNSKIGNKMEYSTDKGNTWSLYRSQISLRKGYTAMFRCTSDAPIDSVTGGIGSFTMTGNVCVEGNIMSLIYGSDFVGKTEMKGTKTFFDLFVNQAAIITSHKLVLPATTLTEACYEHMFSGCKNMINCPEVLPATTVGKKSYHRMLQSCEKMVTVPKISATKVMEEGCKQMFEGCKSFTDQVPDELIYNVTEAGRSAFWSFFNACTNMTKGIKFPQLTEMPIYCFRCMYQTTKLTESPKITINKLNSGCYEQLFNRVSTLSKITITNNFSGQSTGGALNGWVYGVSSSGVMVMPSNLTLPPNSADGVPTGWETQPYS